MRTDEIIGACFRPNEKESKVKSPMKAGATITLVVACAIAATRVLPAPRETTNLLEKRPQVAAGLESEPREFLTDLRDRSGQPRSRQ